jgi:[glutamine synthetase] adenylyltransferase / [glutamine synthetase]-adenylyl-L-tyrosine phosphorylase
MSIDALALSAKLLPRPFDPARAERTFEALGDSIAGMPETARRVFASAFGNSPYLCRLALRDREFLHELWETGPDPVVAQAVHNVSLVHAAADETEAMAVLRRAKRRAALAIALADIAGLWDIDAVTEALTGFADASLGGALRFLLRQAARNAEMEQRDAYALENDSGLIVLAMGKAGAFELNYSSDLDIVAFYDNERFPFRKRGDARSAAVDLVRGLVRLLSEITSDGYVFRTDLRLRPDAGATQIAISTEAAERYYEEIGQNWERAAFIKVRGCAGDGTATDAFLKNLDPFVWRRSLDYGAIEDIHSIKRQIHAHGGHGAIAVAGHNIKLGRGGIREIEFFAQTQQLILGGRDRSLRQRRTVDAIAALRARGLVSDRTSGELTDAYRFLRRLEHRLQMIEDEQTHTLPKTDEGLAHIACFAGFHDVARFSETLLGHLTSVQTHYAALFEASPPLGAAAGSLVFTGVEDDPETLRTISAMGFRDAKHVAHAVRGWHHGRVRATRGARARELLTRLTPALLASLGATAHPDSAFAQFDRFLSRIPAGVQVFALLAANPHLLHLLANVMGSAPRLADHLARKPAMLDAVLDPGFLTEPSTGAELAGILAAELDRAPDFEGVLDAARRFARDQTFRLGVQIIVGRTSPEAGGNAFAAIAEKLIDALLAHLEREVAANAGVVEDGGFCVVAMGKLGGREMTASSDLDLVFVYDAPPENEASNGAKALPVPMYYARLAKRLIDALTVPTAEGTLYEVDMRLRPSGNKGPAAVSLESFMRYHASEAWTWERLALTRARVIAGPAPLRAQIERVIESALTRKADEALLRHETRAMREKLAAQFRAKDKWDLKFAPGGLVDIEFCAQYLQLRHACEAPNVLRQNTVSAIEQLLAHGLLDSSDAADLLAAAHLQLSLLQVLRIAAAGPFDASDTSEGMKALLVRAGEVENFPALEARLADAQSHARGVFEKLLASQPDCHPRGSGDPGA